MNPKTSPRREEGGWGGGVESIDGLFCLEAGGGVDQNIHAGRGSQVLPATDIHGLTSGRVDGPGTSMLLPRLILMEVDQTAVGLA